MTTSALSEAAVRLYIFQILLIRINFDFIEKVQCNVQYCDVIARISLFHVALPASKINS